MILKDIGYNPQKNMLLKIFDMMINIECKEYFGYIT